jgi:hypothetical protein
VVCRDNEILRINTQIKKKLWGKFHIRNQLLGKLIRRMEDNSKIPLEIPVAAELDLISF